MGTSDNPDEGEDATRPDETGPTGPGADAPAEPPVEAPTTAPDVETEPVHPAESPPSTPDPELDPDPYPDVQKEVWGRAQLTRSEILEAIQEMSVLELDDLHRRWTIVFALNGLSPEFRTLSATERLRIVDEIVEQEKLRHS